MKKISAVLLLLLTLLLFGCGSEPQQPTPYITNIDGQQLEITFDPSNASAGCIHTANGDYSFAYQMSGSLEIIYPDGSKCSMTNINGGIAASINYDSETVRAKGFIDRFDLYWVIESAYKSQHPQRSGPSPVIAVLFFAIGAWYLASPYTVWQLSHGWKFKNAEPSDEILILYRIGGGILIFIGVLFVISSL